MCRSERCKRTQPPRLVHGEQRPLQRSVTRSVMQITDYPSVISALDISVPHMMPTAFRAVPTARRLGGSDGRMPGNPVQPRPYSSPGVPALLPARRASPSDGREVRDKGVTYYSVDLGRAQRGGRDNDADRDVTVIPVIPGRRPHQGRYRGAGHHRAGRSARAADRSGPRTASPPGAGTAPSPVPVAHGALLPLVGVALSSGRFTSSSCALPFLSIAGVSRGVRRHQFQLRICRSFRVAGAFRTWP